MDIKSEPADEEFQDSPELIDPNLLKEGTLLKLKSIVQLQCPSCSESFNAEFLLKVHQMLHDPNQYCFICKRKFTKNFDVHVMGKHFNQCSLCLKTFTVNKALKSHMNLHTGNLSYMKCSLCDKVFRQRASLAVHIRASHHGIKPFSCNLCENSVNFTTSSGYNRHMRNFHDPDKPRDIKKARELVCSFCCAPQTSWREKNAHEAEHKGSNSCTDCNLVFNSATDLRKHFALDHPLIDWAFTCEICWKRCKQQHVLNQHMKSTHTMHPCPGCDITFSSPRHLKKHIGKYHNPEKPYELTEIDLKCLLCGLAFPTLGEKKTHSIQHTNPTYSKRECFFCSLVFFRYSTFHQHLLTHNKPLKCEICGKDLKRLNIEKHMRFHKMGKECPICKKAVPQIDLHMKVNHICFICDTDAKFATAYGLRIHYRRFHPEYTRCGKCYCSLLKSEMKPHLKEKHNIDEFFECDRCYFYFYDLSSYENHNKKHIRSRNHHCEKCFLTFRSRVQIANHPCDKKAEFLCPHCSTAFLIKSSLDRHVEIYHSGTELNDNHKEDVLDFQELDESFRGNLRKYQCLKCFLLLNNVKKHFCKIRPRTYEHYRCIMCGLFSVQLITMRKHSKVVHDGIKNWKKVKGKKIIYSIKPNLDLYLKKYPFRCQQCGKRFKLQTSLRDHVCRSVGELHHCPICDTKFKDTKYFYKHMRNYHSPRIIVDKEEEKHLEAKKINDTTTLEVRTKKYQCRVCLVVFHGLPAVKYHSCGFRRANILRNRSRKRLTCSACGYVCLTQKGLKSHMACYHGKKDEAHPYVGYTLENNTTLEMEHLQTIINSENSDCLVKMES